MQLISCKYHDLLLTTGSGYTCPNRYKRIRSVIRLYQYHLFDHTTTLFFLAPWLSNQKLSSLCYAVFDQVGYFFRLIDKYLDVIRNVLVLGFEQGCIAIDGICPPIGDCHSLGNIKRLL